MVRYTKGRLKQAKTHREGIPANIHIQKNTETVPVKVPPEIKQAIPEPRSTWIRKTIIEKLTK